MDRRIARSLVVGLLLMACGTGCERTYRCNTILNEDGSVDRSIEQKEDTLSAAVRGQPVWNSYAVADGLVTAKGHFASAKEIPDHVVITEAGKETRLVRSYERQDYVFVTEYRWKETLPDHVTREEMTKAVDELTDLVAELIPDAFREGVGPDYDVSRLVEWLRCDGRACLHQLAERYYTDRLARRPVEDSHKALTAICERYGLHLTKDGRLLEKEAVSNAFRDFAVSLLVKHVRTKDGKPIDRKMAETWIVEKGPIDMGLGKAINKYGEERMKKKVADVVGRIAGISLFGSLHKFDYSVTAPGLVVETNGERLSEKQVRWQFTAADSYPLGYDMTCRSLAPCAGVQKAVLGGEALTGAEAMQKFVALVEEDKGLVEALRDCKTRAGLKPLQDYRTALAARNDEAGAKRVDQVLELLRRK